MQDLVKIMQSKVKKKRSGLPRRTSLTQATDVYERKPTHHLTAYMVSEAKRLEVDKRTLYRAFKAYKLS